jgi:hypothetical protein
MNRRAFAKGALLLPWLTQAGELFATEETKPKQWAIGFAPPVDAPLFCTTQTRVRSGQAGDIQLKVERQYQFAHFGPGFRLVSTIIRISDNAPPRLSRMLRAGIDPLAGLAIAFTVDASGRHIEVEDMDETWGKVSAAITRIAASAGGSAHTQPLLQHVAGIDDAGRRALLLNEVSDLIRYAGRSDVMGTGMSGDMVSMVEPARGDWQLSGAVHKMSGLCWQLERAFVGATAPRHGIAGSKMQIQL